MPAEYTADTKFAGSAKLIDGGGTYLVFRKVPGGRGKNLSRDVGGGRLPFFRHKTYNAAVTEARRLCARFPESTFIIMQELATVKVREPQLAEQEAA